jgi:hypothetical protein
MSYSRESLSSNSMPRLYISFILVHGVDKMFLYISPKTSRLLRMQLLDPNRHVLLFVELGYICMSPFGHAAQDSLPRPPCMDTT